MTGLGELDQDPSTHPALCFCKLETLGLQHFNNAFLFRGHSHMLFNCPNNSEKYYDLGFSNVYNEPQEASVAPLRFLWLLTTGA